MQSIKLSKSNRNLSLKLFGLFVIAFFSFSLTYSQIVPYMSSLGFSLQQRSWILTLSAIVGILFQVLYGFLCDKYQTIRPFFRMVFSLFMILSALSFSMIPSSLSLQFILIILFTCQFRIAANLVETWAFQINQAIAEVFGFIRLGGSIGWAIGSWLIAEIVKQANYSILTNYIIVSCVITLVITFWISDVNKVLNNESLTMVDIKQLLAIKTYRIAIIIYLVLFIVYCLDGITLVDKMLELGAGSKEVGIKFTMSAFLEIPLFVFGFYFIKRCGLKKLLIFLSLIMGVRFVLYGLAINVEQILWITLLQAFTFPILLVTQKEIVGEIVPLSLRSSGQLLMTALTSNVPIVFVPLITTQLRIFMSFSEILILFGILCIIALLLSFKIKESHL